MARWGAYLPSLVPINTGLRLVQVIGIVNRRRVRARTAELEADKSESAFAKCVDQRFETSSSRPDLLNVGLQTSQLDTRTGDGPDRTAFIDSLRQA